MPETYGLEQLGIKNVRNVYRNMSAAGLVEHALARGEGQLAANGALVVHLPGRRGRSPNDKFVVRTPDVATELWWGSVNRPIEPTVFDHIWSRVTAYLQGRDVYIFDGFVGADLQYSLPLRSIGVLAWQNLFASTLFLRPTPEQLAVHKPQFTVVALPDLLLDGKSEGLDSEVAIIVSFEKKMIVICGSHYGGEIKKSIFTIMNYLLPKRGISSMHCSANIGEKGDTALFFGLSGTGKTTLSADPSRRLIGDDETGWSDDGIFNLEGGCYAKVIRLSAEAEPQIYKAIRFGSLLENVVINPETRQPDYDSDELTENTRATYPVEHIPGCVIPGVACHPTNIFFLTADAFGVLPPISRLTPAMAQYHYLSGYTAKVAGTEAGVVEPTATFSTCFGAPFLPLHPTTYARLLAERMSKHQTECWLVNTGWSGGPYGVGSRMKIQLTRALLSAALSGELANVEYIKDPIFGFLVPKECPGVPSEVLTPRNTWVDKEAYDRKARELGQMFAKNFEQYAEFASAEVKASGPQI